MYPQKQIDFVNKALSIEQSAIELTLFDEYFTLFDEFRNVFTLPNVDDVVNPTKTQSQQKTHWQSKVEHGCYSEHEVCQSGNNQLNLANEKNPVPRVEKTAMIRFMWMNANCTIEFLNVLE